MIFGGHKGAFGGGGGEGGEAALSLNLTALMDILSNLLFFLLASYTAQSVEVEGHAGLKLPSSTSQVALNPQITVTVTETAIDVGGIPYDSLFINNNGSVTFGAAMGTPYTPIPLNTTGVSILAPFFADVSTISGPQVVNGQEFANSVT